MFQKLQNFKPPSGKWRSAQPVFHVITALKVFCTSANHQKFYTLSPHHIYYFFLKKKSRYSCHNCASTWIGFDSGAGLAWEPEQLWFSEACTNSAIAWLQLPEGPWPGCPHSLLLQAPSDRPPGSFCNLFVYLSISLPPFRLALQKFGKGGRMCGWVAVPTGQANLVQANVKGVTWTVAAVWWCLANSKACYTWATFQLTCRSACKLSIAVRHRMSPWFKLKHFDSDPNVYLHVLGTLTSITNLATSLARNMDRLSLDEEHYNRQEEWRRQLPESLGEGLRQGLSRLGISLLGNVLLNIKLSDNTVFWSAHVFSTCEL